MGGQDERGMRENVNEVTSVTTPLRKSTPEGNISYVVYCQ